MSLDLSYVDKELKGLTPKEVCFAISFVLFCIQSDRPRRPPWYNA